MRAFPMPNDQFGGGMVVASCYYTDDVALVLILNPQAPFFTVTHFDLGSGEFMPITTTENIVPAVREYEQNGGDY